MLYAVDTRNMRGEPVAFNQLSLFIQQAGGFGGKRISDKSIMSVDAPKRKPDVSVCEKTSVDQVCKFASFTVVFAACLCRCAGTDTMIIVELILFVFI